MIIKAIRSRPSALNIIMTATAVAALAAPALIVGHASVVRPGSRAVATTQAVVPATEPPPVEPTQYIEVAPADARTINAAVPFSAAPNPAARPFRFAGSAADLARATDCLAAAVIYEAGNGAAGEQAVAQVVINRLRHPAFPKSICGVVFQGEERSTGCQFTFACDGALRRWRPTQAGWRRARAVAAAALAGSVHRPVGHATHYHTDWVVPYWSSSLDKITAVGTHLFFRWTGWWGTPPAFNRRQAGAEPIIAKIAGLSEAHAEYGEFFTSPSHASLVGGPPARDEAADPAPAAVAIHPDGFLWAIPSGANPDLWPALAQRLCGDRPYCKVMAWRDPARTPSGLPLTTAQIASLGFTYFRDRSDGYEKALWNCQQIQRADPAQCLRPQVLLPMAMPSRPDPASGSAIRGGAAGPEPLRPDVALGRIRPPDLPHTTGTGTTPYVSDAGDPARNRARAL